MKEILSDNQSCTLIDKRGNLYEGKCFRSITVSSGDYFSSQELAREKAVNRAIAIANKKAAEAYCLRDITVDEPRPEGPIKFTARVTVDIYIPNIGQ